MPFLNGPGGFGTKIATFWAMCHKKIINSLLTTPVQAKTLCYKTLSSAQNNVIPLILSPVVSLIRGFSVKLRPGFVVSLTVRCFGLSASLTSPAFAQGFDRHTSRFDNPYDPRLVDHSGTRVFDRIESLKTRVSNQERNGELDTNHAHELFSQLNEIEQDARVVARGFGGREAMDRISLRLDRLADILDRIVHRTSLTSDDMSRRH